MLASYEVQFEHLEEGVAVLRCKLDREVQIFLGVFKLEIAIVLVVSHRDAGSLAPDLT